MPRNRQNDDVDDEDEEDDDLDPDEQDDDEEDDDLGELTEDELREQLRKTRDSLSKASGSSKKKRDRIKGLERELAETRANKGKPAGKKDDEKGDAPDADAIRQTVEAELTAKANDRIKRAEARGALKAAGVPAGQVGDLVAMLKLDDISVGGDGEVDSDDLDEAIAALKEKWPQLFAPVRTTRKRQRVAGDGDRDGSRDKAPRKKLSASQLQAAAALGRVAR